MRRGILAAGAVVVLTWAGLGLTGCTISPPSCMPAELTASPHDVERGGVVTLSSQKPSCDVHYEVGKTYSVTIMARHIQSPAVDVPVSTDGSFSELIAVPSDFPVGTAYIIVTGSPADHCDDGGGSCAGYAAEITVR